MAIVVKGEITITKGFDTWKAMVKKNHKRMEEMGMVMLFAGVQKDDPTKLHAIMTVSYTHLTLPTILRV